MRLNDVMGLLKSDDIIDKTITITVDKDGCVTDFSLHDNNRFYPKIPKTYSPEEGPYEITCSDRRL